MPLPWFPKKTPPQPAPAGLQNLALSVRQPYAELILRGKKQIEYRTVNTKIRGRVYLYASQTPGEKKDFARLGLQPSDLPTGVLVGTVEILGCERVAEKEFEWELANPERLEIPLKPVNQAQPVWFHPFPS